MTNKPRSKRVETACNFEAASTLPLMFSPRLFLAVYLKIGTINLILLRLIIASYRWGEKRY